ncbi:hypothetical protein [Novosphingobium aerophilum]|uniref:Uncharacterized protein n=1 Tax=Novosphingobium aerophilum TaxID=2839843 RepID=A0A7X1F7P2_9SPHN|nr:hypothetical protein [Novosphingobium aerophilum]MBC2651940.1 hypothetical protein [Novosphingobium aerophilum]
MGKATFETPDEQDIEVDSDEVVRLAPGREEGTTIIELDTDGELVVIGTALEVAAELGLNPLEYIDAEDDDESIEDLVDDDD